LFLLIIKKVIGGKKVYIGKVFPLRRAKRDVKAIGQPGFANTTGPLFQHLAFGKKCQKKAGCINQKHRQKSFAEEALERKRMRDSPKYLNPNTLWNTVDTLVIAA
jgi:hypothetical protein